MSRQRPKLSYANVAATLALVIAVSGGTALAVGGKIGTKRLKNNAVKTKKIANGAVTNPKLADGAVSSTKLAAGAVTAADLAAGSITAVAIAVGAVGTEELADDAVTSDKIIEEGVDSSDIEDDAVNTVDIDSNALDVLDADCPTGMTQTGGYCVDSTTRTAQVWLTAVRDCVNEELEVPAPGVAAMIAEIQLADNVEIWTDSFIGGTPAQALVSEDTPTGVTIDNEDTSNTNVYVCVTTLNDDN
jgi:hypothetical protein